MSDTKTGRITKPAEYAESATAAFVRRLVLLDATNSKIGAEQGEAEKRLVAAERRLARAVENIEVEEDDGEWIMFGFPSMDTQTRFVDALAAYRKLLAGGGGK